MILSIRLLNVEGASVAEEVVSVGARGDSDAVLK
jgi:hypothetical protein